MCTYVIKPVQMFIQRLSPIQYTLAVACAPDDFMTGNGDKWCGCEAVQRGQSAWVFCFDRPTRPLMICL